MITHAPFKLYTYCIIVVACVFSTTVETTTAQNSMTKYVRYSYMGADSYGILRGDVIHTLDGDFIHSSRETGVTIPLANVRLLAPVTPSKVIAVGLNYKSHLGERPASEYPGLFAKYPSSLIAQNEAIVIPADSKNLHYEGELVIVIGKKAKNISATDARDYIFGVTVGNDISERDWQLSDLQWLRAKASDTFAPVGPVVVQGLNYNNLLLETRLNGKTVQSERTRDLLFNVDTIMSYVTTYFTLMPGDIIFTGTPGSTLAMKPGDVVEVEIESIGILQNHVRAAASKN